MIAAIRSEYRKFFSTRLWWILMAGMFVYVLVISGVMAGVFGYAATHQADQSGGGGMSLPLIWPMVYSLGPSMAYVFPAIIGALGWTNEYRHHTTVPTYLGEPRRLVVAVAKAVAGIPMGVVNGVVGTAASVIGGAIGFSIMKVDPGLGLADTWQTIGLSVLALAIWAVVGVGLGMLLTNQVGVIVVLLIWKQLIESLLRVGLAMFNATENIPQYLPGALSDSVAGGHSIFSMIMLNGSTTEAASMPIWSAALLLVGYGLVFGVLGYIFRTRRDVN